MFVTAWIIAAGPGTIGLSITDVEFVDARAAGAFELSLCAGRRVLWIFRVFWIVGRAAAGLVGAGLFVTME